MSLETPEFSRRFLIHVLPQGFHRIRHYGLFANGQRAENLAKARALLGFKPTHGVNNNDADDSTPPDWLICPTCRATMHVIEIFESGHAPPPHDPEAYALKTVCADWAPILNRQRHGVAPTCAKTVQSDRSNFSSRAPARNPYSLTRYSSATTVEFHT